MIKMEENLQDHLQKLKIVVINVH